MDAERGSLRAYAGEEPCVFVSYAHEDSVLVHRLLEVLASAGIRLWFDEGIHPGSSWRDELAQAIERCQLFLYLVTRASSASPNCQRECNYALDQNKQVLVVHLDEAVLPRGLSLSLAGQQAIIAYRQSSGELQTQLIEAVQHLLKGADAASRTGNAWTTDQRRWWRSTRWWAAFVVVIGIGVGAIWWLDSRGGSRETRPARLELLVSTQDAATFPSISRDGSLLAYVGGEGNRRDLFVRTLGLGAPVRITNDDARESTPRFSPDGTAIAFARFDAEGRLPAVYRIAALGGESRLIAEASRTPAWSPDGESLAYVNVRRDHVQSVRMLDFRSSVERTLFELTSPYVSITALDVGQGGQCVVVLSTGGAAGELWQIDAAGVAQRVMEDLPSVFAHDAVFSEDGRAVIYSSNRAGATNLWLQRFDGEPPEQLTRGSGPDEVPSVAADGRVVFQNSRSREVLLLVDMDGREEILASHHASIWAPAFSPDGKRIAFSRAETDGRWHIWVTNRDGTGTRQVTDGDKPEIYPRFSADGLHVLYFSWALPNGRVWRADVEGGVPQPVTPETWDASYADMSNSGRIVLTRAIDGEDHIVLLNDPGMPAAQPIDLGPGTLPRWAPNEQWIAFALDRGVLRGIHLVRPDGTDRRRLTEIGGWPTWFPDGRIGFTALGADANQQNFFASVDGGMPVPLTGPRYGGNNFPFDVAPDARSIVTSNADHLSDEIWLLSR